MLRIAVCDDEAEMCAELEEMVAAQLNKMGVPHHITCYTGADGLLDAAPGLDLIFLDIRMPGSDGLALAKILRENAYPCALVFVTVLRECMLDAFEVEAAGYLCKPVDGARLESALHRVIRQMETKREPYLSIQTLHGVRSVRVSKICYCEVINRTIYLHTTQEVITYYGKMRELESRLGSFLKCHRSYLVNPAYLREYTGGQCILEDGSVIPVARSRQQSVKEKMLCWLREGTRR